VLDQCLWLLQTDHPAAISPQHGLAFLQPLLLYLFCDPNYHAHFAALRGALFAQLLDSCRHEDNSCYFSCLQQLIRWMQWENRASLPEMAAYVHKFFQFLLTMGDAHSAGQLRYILLTFLK
jgi:hypothetical protein